MFGKQVRKMDLSFIFSAQGLEAVPKLRPDRILNYPSVFPAKKHRRQSKLSRKFSVKTFAVFLLLAVRKLPSAAATSFQVSQS